MTNLFKRCLGITPGLRPALAILTFATVAWGNPLSPGNFVLSNLNADGSVTTPSGIFPSDAYSFDLMGGNNGSVVAGETDFLWQAPSDGTVQFNWSYTSCFPANQGSPFCDDPVYDFAGYMVGLVQTQLTNADTGGVIAAASFRVTAGSTFGWYVGTLDNENEPGTLTVSGLSFTSTGPQTPEPGSLVLGISGLALLLGAKLRRVKVLVATRKSVTRYGSLFTGLLVCVAAFGQVQNVYNGAVVTGQLQLIGTTNLTQIGNATPGNQITVQTAGGPELPKFRPALPLPPPRVLQGSQFQLLAGGFAPSANSLAVVTSPTSVGFDGLTHRDQRLANGGNQFSLEPPNPSIAAANGKILEGVNNAVRVFNAAGAALTPAITANQLFGLAPAIDRTKTPNVYGVYTTDMRVFFDQDISRWMVMQRSQDEDSAGNPLSQSHIYLAVSKTIDPAGDYNIYAMDTTNAANQGCPCVDDYPQIGADRYGLYISSNEYGLSDPNNPFFNDATILAISKADLAAGILTPTAARFIMLDNSGYEFSVQPATTPPGAVPVLGNGGVEYFVSSYPIGFDTNLALWALSNTASLQSANPTLLLTQTTVPTLAHVPPPAAVPQKSGPLTLGTSLETLDAGFFSDSRVLSTSYSGGRLYVTLASSVIDSLGRNAAGGLYVVFSPVLRGGILSGAAPIKQGYISATSNHILRPAIAVNPTGRGVIAFTLVGNDYYPSSAFVTIDLTPSTPSAVQITAAGYVPEDGFSGYGPSAACPTCSGFGVARWGDYSTAVTSTDGTIWFVSEYIPNALRTPLANWGTFISKFQP